MESMNIVIVGHVDHGKSTMLGRLLADTQALPDGKLEALRELCRRNAKPFEYAFLLDALKDERSQGITIDAARCFFKTAKREYIIIDAPGHIEFLKNMITGAARAEAALLVIDAREGICENSRRHGYMLSMLGIKQMAVVVNKMDLVGWDGGVYERIVRDYGAFLSEIGVKPAAFIPVSSVEGDNIAVRSERMDFYRGGTVLEQLDSFTALPDGDGLPFRMPVQDVYKFTEDGDDRRIVAGYVESGSLRAGDEVVFAPSGKRSVVKDIVDSGDGCARCGDSVGFTCDTQIYTRRGELAFKAGETAPQVSRSFRANIFWLGRAPMERGRIYRVKLGAAKTAARLVSVTATLDASTLESSVKDKVERFDIADVTIECEHALAFDLTDSLAATSRFVIVDGYEIAGGGIIKERAEAGERFTSLELPLGAEAMSALDSIREKTGETAAEVVERLILSNV